MTDYADKESLPKMGFIAVECFFHRPPGDAFNEHTWKFPLVRELAEGSKEGILVSRADYDETFINNFVTAGKKLAARGAVGIITSCGFLALAQPLLAARLPIPIATSSLIQIPSILAWLAPTKKIGIITYNEAQLGALHFERLGISKENAARCYVTGVPADGHLRNLVGMRKPFDFYDIEAEMMATAKTFVAEHDDISVIVLECTQMPTFAASVQKAVGLPVYDVYTMASWFYSSLVRQRPVGWGKLEDNLSGPMVERNVM
ncbi:aspartate racemase [Ophiostoma piceae UAMH 11346]|uniref:Aspartate racemase n=1 Tax=Ophiostoma piceae (strain UAMH 11346) TaxID=1262450 RepID=S3CAV1_OPHP1|nr:aspartate racemase [Ophiostoma piceae UAMH 11346]